jgi:hypothetical protein
MKKAAIKTPKSKGRQFGGLLYFVRLLAIENVHRDFKTIPQIGRFGFAPGHLLSPSKW